MKLIAPLAILALGAQAVKVQADTATEQMAGSTAPGSDSEGYSAPIVPENYDEAVQHFDLDTPFTDQECYQKQIDIYSDQILAIEALRLEILQLTKKINEAENDFELNKQKIAENKAKIGTNSSGTYANRAKIDLLYADAWDVKECLERQNSE